MLIDIFINFIYSCITTLLSPITALPDVTLSANVTTAFNNARGFLSALDFVLPYSTFLTIIALIVGIEAGILVYKVIYWLIKRIPTQS